VVLELLHRVLVALAVGIVYLRPTGDARFDQVPEMIKRDRLLIAFSALAPFRARTNQADVAFERVPKLRQLIQSKFPQPTSHRRNATIAFARVNAFFLSLVRLAVHRSEFEKNESSPVTANSFLPEKDRTTVFHPYEQRHEHEKRRAND